MTNEQGTSLWTAAQRRSCPGRDGPPGRSQTVCLMDAPPSHTGRKVLPHDTPLWVDPDASEFFITINCQRRGTNQLCLPGIGESLLAAARFYYEQRKWFPSPFLLMPDHLHLLVSFGRGHEMTRVVTAWKRYVATPHGIEWQCGFFEHRLRRAESAREKGEYILHNPVRAGLVEDAAKWPYWFKLNDQ